MIVYFFIGFIIVLCAYAISILIKSESVSHQHEKDLQIKIDQGTEENKKLQNALDQEMLKREAYKILERDGERLKKEKQDIFMQIKDKDDQLSELTKTLELLQETGTRKLKEAQEAMETLTAQQAAAKQLEEERIAKTQSEANMTVEELRKDRDLLAAVKLKLEQELNQIKEMNEQFSQKEKVMQYDLTRSRAQALGLEKMCEDFKIQIEEMERSLEKVRSGTNPGETV